MGDTHINIQGQVDEQLLAVIQQQLDARDQAQEEKPAGEQAVAWV
jgi:hypothetical protein